MLTPASALDASLTTNDAEFSKQLAYLRCAGYTSVTLQQLFDGIYTGAPLPTRCEGCHEDYHHGEFKGFAP